MKSRFTFFILVMVGATALAQDGIQTDSLVEKPAGKKVVLGHYFIFKAGPIIKGCQSCSPFESVSFTGSAESGIRIGRELSIGGGFGFNSFYSVHTIPVFGNISLNIGKKNQVITGLRLGGSKIARFEDAYGEYGLKERKAGRLFEPYAGYMIAYHDLRIYLLVGFLKQRIKSNYEYPNWYYVDGVLTEFDPSTRSVMTDYRRMTFTLGIGWK